MRVETRGHDGGYPEMAADPLEKINHHEVAESANRYTSGEVVTWVGQPFAHGMARFELFVQLSILRT